TFQKFFYFLRLCGAASLTDAGFAAAAAIEGGVHVRCLIDECANIGQIPQLEKLVSTIRSREISACLVLQTRSQLKAIYKDNADTIVGNMDSQIFLGGSEHTTLKDLAEALGKETIDSYNNSDTRGNSPSYGT
ncbi:TraG/TraD/VirD4 family protein, partial [Faecalibacterium sp. DFI.5.82]|uniref:TraG/TraD/VirD4 family protein n=1 Tax=Faecalibacterium sp. DFI.5.82 TaxID=3031725 RepID=UPI0023B204A4